MNDVKQIDLEEYINKDLAKQITLYTNNLFRSGNGFFYHNSLVSNKYRHSIGHIIYNSDINKH